MAFNIAFIIQAINKFSGPAKEIANSTNMMIHRFKRMGAAGLALQHKMQSIFLKMALPIGALSVGLLHTAATFQTLRMSLGVMMGDQKKANQLFHQFVVLSQKWGAATTEEFAKAGRTLLAVGGKAKNIPIVLGEIADLASVAGLRLEDVAHSVARVFARGIVKLRFIKTLATSTTILQTMADQLKITKSHLMKLMSAGKLSAGVFLRAMHTISAKGGIAFQGQKRAAATLRGGYFLIKDAMQILLAVMGLFLAKNFDIIDNLMKLKNVIIGVKNHFGSFMEKYGPLVRKTESAIIAFLALIAATFALGVAMRLGAVWVSVFTGALWLARIAAVGVVRVWKTLKWVWRAMNTEIAITDILLSPILIVLALVAIAVAALVYVFIRWHKQIGSLIETRLKPLLWIWKKLGHFVMWLVDLFKKHFPIIANVIGKEVDWIVKKFDVLIDKIKHFIGFFHKIGHAFKKWHHWVKFGTAGKMPPTLKALIETTATTPALSVMPAMAMGKISTISPGIVPLQMPLKGGDLQDAFTTALANSGLSEGLTAHINVGVSSDEGLKIDRVTHMSSMPNVEVGTIMPLAAGGY